MWLVTAMPAAAPPPLTAVRLRVVRVALVLGWVSIGVVLAGSMLPEMQHVDVSHPLVWALAGVAAVANTVLAALPWPRLVDRSIGGTLLTAWAVGLIGLVTALTAADGGLASEYHLLYVLVIPFVATTEPRRRHLPLYALLLTGYSAAVLLLPGPAPLGVLVVRLGVLAAGCGLATVIARILVDNALARTQAESEARMERVLADEAHHRIKNNLQLVADLLILRFHRRRPAGPRGVRRARVGGWARLGRLRAGAGADSSARTISRCAAEGRGLQVVSVALAPARLPEPGLRRSRHRGPRRLRPRRSPPAAARRRRARGLHRHRGPQRTSPPASVRLEDGWRDHTMRM